MILHDEHLCDSGDPDFRFGSAPELFEPVLNCRVKNRHVNAVFHTMLLLKIQIEILYTFLFDSLIATHTSSPSKEVSAGPVI